MTMPEPPYWAVIFPNQRTDKDEDGYSEMAARMEALAVSQSGYLGIHSTRGSDGFGITVSYWESEQAILEWKANVEHEVAQRTGIERWYDYYEVRIAKVERQYSGPSERDV